VHCGYCLLQKAALAIAFERDGEEGEDADEEQAEEQKKKKAQQGRPEVQPDCPWTCMRFNLFECQWPTFWICYVSFMVEVECSVVFGRVTMTIEDFACKVTQTLEEVFRGSLL
jgi:hypothetical protein